MKINMKLLILVIFFIVGIGVISAADSYRLNAGLSVVISEHGVTKKVTNNGANDMFIPTKSAAEWSNFRANTPASTTVVDGCFLSSHCSSGYYCSSSTNTCANLPTCAEANSGTGYNPQESNEDLWNDCNTIGCNTGNCRGGLYSCGYYTFGQRNCFIGYECNSQGDCEFSGEPLH